MATDPKPKRDSLKPKLIMAAVSTLIGLGGLEMMARVVTKNRAFQADPELIRSLAPNNPGVVPSYETEDNLNGRSKEIPAQPEMLRNPTNNLGFRMTEDVGPKAPNEKRILLLGDSYTEAYQVHGDHRFSEIVDRALRQDPATKDWRVINGGVENGCPSQYHMQLNRWLPELKPDIVVVNLAPNDLSDDIGYQREYCFGFDHEGMPDRVLATSRLWWQKHLYLARALDVLAVTGRAPWMMHLRPAEKCPEIEPVVWHAMACAGDEELHKKFRENTGKYLVGLRDKVERTGAKFAVMMVQYSYFFENEAYYEPAFAGLKERLVKYGCWTSQGRPYQEFVEAFLNEKGIRFQNPYAVLAKEEADHPTHKLWNYRDYHYSEAGHQIVAAQLLELLRPMVAPQGAAANASP
jgi:hypothetical protein